VSPGARSWLAGRRVSPPGSMSPWLGIEDEDGMPVWQSLARGGVAALNRARSAPGRVRESAYHLLRADALLTYACEAVAEESDDPENALVSILQTVGARRR